MFNPKTFANSRPDGIGVLEIVDDNEPKPDQPRLFVPLKRTELSGEITGPLAALRLTQTYGFTREQCEKTLEAVYRFPLPGDAAVTKVRVRFGEVEINAELKERGQAETEYQEARRAGRQAALATRESPDVFTLQVAGLQPDQEVTVETSYVQLARAEGAGWSLRIPLTTSPRYVRSDELTSRHAQGQPLALLRDPGHRFALDLNLRGAGAVESNTHSLNTNQDGDGVRVTLRDGEAPPDRDCVVHWRPQQAEQSPAFQAWLQDDPDSAQIYFLAMVAPPSSRAGERALREAILLVDHSGSMEGAKWAAADWAVKSFLYGMAERDQFALGVFHSTTRWFDNKLRQANGQTIEEAVRFLETSKETGGTELGVALEQALALERAKDERARHALVITDAEVSDAGRILRLVSDQNADRRRISVLCIDAAPNSHLAMELAERGGGVAKFLTSDPAEEDISTALDEVLADWAEPLLPNLRLEVNRVVAQAAGREVKNASEAGRSAIDLGDLPAGRAVWVAGRVPRGKQTDLSFRVRASNDQTVAEGRVELPQLAGDQSAIKALFGARRVLGLEYLINSGYSGQELREQLARLGYDPDEALASRAAGKPKVYAENVREDASRALRDLLVREALDYGLASSETAFVATRTEAGKVVEESVAVANALPAGWSDRFLSYNTGAYQVMACLARPASMRMDSVMFESPEMDYLEDAGPTAGFAAQEYAALSEHDSSQLATLDYFAAEPAAPRGGNQTLMFSGVPSFTGAEALLFDSDRDQATLPDWGTISRLRLSFPDGAPPLESLDAGLSLLIFVDDLSAPRARVRLVDVARQGGVRPLNLARQSGQTLRIVLADPAGVWSKSAPRIEVALNWTR
jgi:Ca-activated chloride channel family protein